MAEDHGAALWPPPAQDWTDGHVQLGSNESRNSPGSPGTIISSCWCWECFLLQRLLMLWSFVGILVTVERITVVKPIQFIIFFLCLCLYWQWWLWWRPGCCAHGSPVETSFKCFSKVLGTSQSWALRYTLKCQVYYTENDISWRFQCAKFVILDNLVKIDCTRAVRWIKARILSQTSPQWVKQ